MKLDFDNEWQADLACILIRNYMAEAARTGALVGEDEKILLSRAEALHKEIGSDYNPGLPAAEPQTGMPPDGSPSAEMPFPPPGAPPADAPAPEMVPEGAVFDAGSLTWKLPEEISGRRPLPSPDPEI